MCYISFSQNSKHIFDTHDFELSITDKFTRDECISDRRSSNIKVIEKGRVKSLRGSICPNIKVHSNKLWIKLCFNSIPSLSGGEFDCHTCDLDSIYIPYQMVLVG